MYRIISGIKNKAIIHPRSIIVKDEFGPDLSEEARCLLVSSRVTYLAYGGAKNKIGS